MFSRFLNKSKCWTAADQRPPAAGREEAARRAQCAAGVGRASHKEGRAAGDVLGCVGPMLEVLNLRVLSGSASNS